MTSVESRRTPTRGEREEGWALAAAHKSLTDVITNNLKFLISCCCIIIIFIIVPQSMYKCLYNVAESYETCRGFGLWIGDWASAESRGRRLTN